MKVIDNTPVIVLIELGRFTIFLIFLLGIYLWKKRSINNFFSDFGSLAFFLTAPIWFAFLYFFIRIGTADSVPLKITQDLLRQDTLLIKEIGEIKDFMLWFPFPPGGHTSPTYHREAKGYGNYTLKVMGSKKNAKVLVRFEIDIDESWNLIEYKYLEYFN